MTELGDLQLDKWRSPGEPERSGFALRIAVIVAVLLGIVAAGYFLYWRKPQQPPAAVRSHTEQPVAAEAKPKPVAEPGEVIDLPELSQTDPIVRQLVGGLSTHASVAAWLAGDQLIRNFTVTALNIAGGRSPSMQLNRLRPTQKFQARGSGADLSIDPRSYTRYNTYADAVASLDARGTARLYATLKPRIQDAYKELGYPDGNFDAVMAKAINELLQTPVVEGRVGLVSKSVAYEFADPRLQALSPAQRQLLRMGPRNMRLIQGKLQEIAPLIGVDVAEQ
jgi:Protein of unknown function (DUF3014)